MYAITRDGIEYRRTWWNGFRWVDHSNDARWFRFRDIAEQYTRIEIAVRPAGNWSVVDLGVREGHP